MALCSVVVVLTLAGSAAEAAADPRLRVEADPSGEVAVVARAVPITRALEALAMEAGFELTIFHAPERPAANVSTDMAPIEDVLREMLRHRNHALVFDGEGSVSEVILLAPSTTGPSRPARRARKAGPPRGPIVVVK